MPRSPGADALLQHPSVIATEPTTVLARAFARKFQVGEVAGGVGRRAVFFFFLCRADTLPPSLF